MTAQDFLCKAHTRCLSDRSSTLANITLEFVAFAVPGFFEGQGVFKRPAGIEHDTQSSREYLVVDFSFEFLDDVIVQKILTDHETNDHYRCDKKIQKSRFFNIAHIANCSIPDKSDHKESATN